MLSLREVLSKASEFRTKALKMNMEFGKIFNKVGITVILEKNSNEITAVVKQKQMVLNNVGEHVDELLILLELKKNLLDIQSLFYDFSEFVEPVDLLPYLKQSEYKYIMTKAREKNEDIASACRIGNVMFAVTFREIANNNNRWGLMIYRIKEKWRRQNIKLVV
ncbi:hypothetical protein M1N64_03915 [Peptococcaceae bacterium]|nr:hypothetical protein [Peptococcaceae bacterium]